MRGYRQDKYVLPEKHGEAVVAKLFGHPKYAAKKMPNFQDVPDCTPARRGPDLVLRYGTPRGLDSYSF